MSRLHTVLSFFALPCEQQVELLPEVPFDRGASDYHTALRQNPLYLLVCGLSEEYSQTESETESDYQARTGMRSCRSSGAMNELDCFIYLLCHHFCADDYWSQRALGTKDEWKLFRRLARLALDEAGWPVTCVRKDVRDAVDYFRRAFAHA